MTINSFQILFDRILSSSLSTEVTQILKDLGDSPEIGLDKEFNKLGLYWHAYGNNEFNIGTIGVSSKPGRSLTERITNAIDAIFEERFLSSSSKPVSPQKAASEWFGRPVSGPDSGLFQWDYSSGNYDKKVQVVLNPGETKESPTIDVIDKGIGIPANQFHKTILSLQQGNKMTKKYLAGAFGQGGSSTLTFCDYAFIFSIPKQSNQIAFTLIKKIKLSDDYKEDCYAYLTTKDSNGDYIVPFFESSNAIELYSGNSNIKSVQVSSGTLVRHFGYRLTNLHGSLAPLGENLYHYLHFSMFDTLLPFRIIDRREEGKERDEIVKGSRNRLMEHTVNREEQTSESRTQLKHYRPMEFVVPSGSIDPCIGIEYWVLFNYEKKKVNAEYTLRSDSNSLFVQRRQPIIFTLNGQNQGELPSTLLKSINLGLVSRHIVIHVDASRINKEIRTNLFVTNREGLKDGPVLDSIKLELERMLKEDQALEILERELVEKITSKETEETDSEVKKQITKLLIEAGFTSSVDGQVAKTGNDTPQSIEDPKRKKYKVKDPLPTLPYPNVTKFKIISPTKLLLRINDTEIVLAETDADSEFDRRNSVFYRFDPNIVELASKAPLSGGRIRWRFRAAETSKIGDKGELVAGITKPDGTQITDKIEFEILPAIEKESKPDKGTIPPFKIIPIDPSDDNWLRVWEDIDESSPEVKEVAYKPMDVGGIIHVFYSTIFTQFQSQSDKLKTQSESMYNLFKTNYEVWIGYHAILQFKGQTNNQTSSLDEEALEKERENERSRVAQVEVKQAIKTAELMFKLTRQDATMME